jgi:hypothetical protein
MYTYSYHFMEWYFKLWVWICGEVGGAVYLARARAHLSAGTWSAR